MSLVADEVSLCWAALGVYHMKSLDRLQNMDFFILDNSIHESAVGQLNTLENNIEIFEQVKKCGIKDIIVASFSNMTRVNDDFCQHLVDSGEDFTNLYSFSEVSEGLKDGRYDTVTIPVSSMKNKKYGIRNTVFEMDLTNADCDWGGKWTETDQVNMLRKLFKWVRAEIYQDARILVNFRDFSLTMKTNPGRVLEVVRQLSSLPDEERVFGVVYEDMGDSLPEELGIWTECARNIMNSCGWTGARLMLHVHEQWDLQTATTLTCLEHGADGVWASLCEEGLGAGHACSSITTMNLVRLGNQKVLDRYNCVEMREAARKVTKLTTGRDPSPRQVLYGERARDLVSGFPMSIVRTFDNAKFFGTGDMIRDRLENLFGKDPQFTQEMGGKMLEDLRSGRKEEYQSKTTCFAVR